MVKSQSQPPSDLYKTNLLNECIQKQASGIKTIMGAGKMFFRFETPQYDQTRRSTSSQITTLYVLDRGTLKLCP